MDSESGHMSLVVFKPPFVKIPDNLSQHPIQIFYTHIFLYVSVGIRRNKLLMNHMT